MKLPLILATGLIVSASLMRAAEPASPPATGEPCKASLDEAALAELQGNILPFWLKHAPDSKYGGIIGQVNDNLKARPDAPRGALLTARVLWTFSSAYRMFGNEEYLGMAKLAMDDLENRYTDKVNGGLVWMLNPKSGKVLEERKMVYVQSFGIYAYSEYYRATSDKAALDKAIGLYKLIEAHCHDDANGGYFEEMTVDWKKSTVRGEGRKGSPMGSFNQNSQNVHLHILEAYTNLYRVWPDKGLEARLRELIVIMLDRVLDEKTMHLHLFMDEAWNPSGDTISYGHDIEFAWLLCEAAEVLGDEALLKRSEDVAVKIATVTASEGMNAKGGLYNFADRSGLVDDNMEWWPQAEAVVGFLNAYQISGDEKFLSLAERTWAFIESSYVDCEKGEWHHELSAKGKPDGAPKINFWKCPYHNGRACMEVVRRFEAMASESALKLNELEYLEKTGLNVMLAHDYYPEGHQGGVGIIQNGLRVATNGDVRLHATPGQWQATPVAGERMVDRESGAISVHSVFHDPKKDKAGFNPVDYPDIDLSYTVSVVPAGGDSFRIIVDLDKPLPPEWVGKVGFNMEFFPGYLFGKGYIIGDSSGVFTSQANGPAETIEGSMELAALGRGKTLSLAPESSTQAMLIEAVKGGEIALLDGRALHNNGWFVARAHLEAGLTKGALEWLVTARTVPGWKSEPVIQVSQVGYHPSQEKVAVIELDKNDARRPEITLFRSDAKKGLIPVISGKGSEWGRFLRYNYLRFDFSSVREPGMYVLAYGDKYSEPFKIGKDVFDRGVWQPTLGYFLPVQMCHMRVIENYRVWHGLCHEDDALMAPVNHTHFDGYAQGPSTLCDYKPGDHVPGLNVGGWHDAGDYDLRVESQAGTIYGMSLAWELFRPEMDDTTIDQAQKLVMIHRPDGKPDMLQQIEHGAMSIVAGHKALGRLYRGIIVPSLHQYTHLGDAATMTDNKVFTDDAERSAMKVHMDYAKRGDQREPDMGGLPPLGYDGSADDRWVFTENNPMHEYWTAAGLAAASRALRGYNDELADDCLRIAKDVYLKAEDSKLGKPMQFMAALELLICTGEARYRDDLIARADLVAEMPERLAWVGARSLDLVDDADYRARMMGILQNVRALVGEMEKQTPYGIPYEPKIWGAAWEIENMGVQLYFLHRHVPELFPAKYMFRSLDFLFGCHPGPNNASLVSGVGAKSVQVAYGVNRADWSYIPGGVVSGTALIRPDFPELLEWPYLWQQTEYCLGTPTGDYIFLVLAAKDLLKNEQ